MKCATLPPMPLPDRLQLERAWGVHLTRMFLDGELPTVARKARAAGLDSATPEPERGFWLTFARACDDWMAGHETATDGLVAAAKTAVTAATVGVLDVRRDSGDADSHARTRARAKRLRLAAHLDRLHEAVYRAHSHAWTAATRCDFTTMMTWGHEGVRAKLELQAFLDEWRAELPLPVCEPYEVTAWEWRGAGWQESDLDS
jgi:hypothetical protein